MISWRGPPAWSRPARRASGRAAGHRLCREPDHLCVERLPEILETGRAGQHVIKHASEEKWHCRLASSTIRSLSGSSPAVSTSTIRPKALQGGRIIVGIASQWNAAQNAVIAALLEAGTASCSRSARSVISSSDAADHRPTGVRTHGPAIALRGRPHEKIAAVARRRGGAISGAAERSVLRDRCLHAGDAAAHRGSGPPGPRSARPSELAPSCWAPAAP